MKGIFDQISIYVWSKWQDLERNHVIASLACWRGSIAGGSCMLKVS